MLAASVWLGHSRGRSWSCDQCRGNPSLRARRGDCGGPFQDGLPQAQRDVKGLWVPGYRVAPDCGEEFAELEIRSCPVAGANRMATLITAYNRHRSGLATISQTYPRPTCAVMEAMDTLHYHRESAQYRAQERAMQEANHG